MAKKAIFLDRDGTINEDPGYLSHPGQMILIPGVAEALGKLKRHGFYLIVVSNQSGVGRGLIGLSAMPLINQRLNELLRPSAAEIDRFFLCFHRPEAECVCRKPKAQLLFDARDEVSIDLAQSYMVGDKISDLEAGWAAGCRASILVRTGAGQVSEAKLRPGQASFIADSLQEAADWILSQENAVL